MARKSATADAGNESLDIEAIRSALIGWYAHSGRELPWRAQRHDAYRVLVSETMLVQTTVAAVIPFYHRFLERFPTIEALAGAAEADVLKHWEGLGYYRRARQLHALAKVVTDRFDGIVPAGEAELMALPGVGRYIAGAVRSFAYDQAAPILEANTIRLIARLIGLAEDVTATKSQKRLWQTAAKLVPASDPGTFNQAMMDLGSTVCTPRNAACSTCPLADHCIAYAKGRVESIPVRPTRQPPKPGEEAAIVLTRAGDGAVVLLRRREEGLWSSFWELPTFWLSGADPAKRAEVGAAASRLDEVPAKTRSLLGIENEVTGDVPETTLQYVVTRYRMRLHVLRCGVLPKGTMVSEPVCPAGWAECRFFGVGQLSELTMPSAHRKALAMLIR